VKLLLDANLSPSLAIPLRSAGYTVAHVADLGLLTASDDTIFERAVAGRHVVITADSDFPMMLALRRADSPSVVLLRHVNELARDEQAALLIANLPTVLNDLECGAIVSLSPTRMAVRRLPIA
jgi:predicted nuclease of predicted toxin-antitoxin system